MRSIVIIVDERAQRVLDRLARELGRSVEDLARAAVEDEALRAELPEDFPSKTRATP